MKTRWLCSLLLGTVSVSATAADWSVRLQAWQAEDFELPGMAAEETERRSARFAWARTHEAGRTGIAYEHQPLLIRTGDPATNGYLHQVDVFHSGRIGPSRFDVALGIHGSSNIFTHAEFRSDALVGRFRALYPIPGIFDAVGLAGDYRFGRFLVYPRLTAAVPLDGTRLTLDLPVSLALEDTGGQWRVGIERYGEHWATLDTTETVEGKLYLDEWRLEGRYRLWSSQRTRVDAGLGTSFDTDTRLLDLKRGDVEGDIEPAFYGFIELTR